MTAITREEFDEWVQHPVTVQMRKQISKDINMMQDMLLTVGEEDLKHLQGRCAAAINLVNMEYDHLYE